MSTQLFLCLETMKYNQVESTPEHVQLLREYGFPKVDQRPGYMNFHPPTLALINVPDPELIGYCNFVLSVPMDDPPEEKLVTFNKGANDVF